MWDFFQGEKDPDTEKAEADSEEKEQGDNKDGKSVPPHIYGPWREKICLWVSKKVRFKPVSPATETS